MLIKEGHSPRDIANYSLGQVFLYIELIAKRYDREIKTSDKEKDKENKDKGFKSYRESILAGKSKKHLRKK